MIRFRQLTLWRGTKALLLEQASLARELEGLEAEWLTEQASLEALGA